MIFVIDVLIGIFVFISVSEVLYIDVIEDELFDFVILEIICIMYGNFFLFGIIVWILCFVRWLWLILWCLGELIILVLLI